ncbi:MAG: tripartite tricarboxylate transporter substrate binding protein [Betaproteobacteria bacterium]|nr:tripartite tricarboxylate transporter substrate binding protein [Betaproteobacteria bacterium]
MRLLKLAIFLCPALAACSVTALALAQSSGDDYPAKPVTIAVPFAAGASHDRMLRPYMQSILESTGKIFLLAFKPGAGTTIGTASVAQAAPDGYTIVSASPAFVMTPSVYPDLPYDNVKDFAPISLLSEQAWLLVVPASSPYKTVSEYIAYAKAHPGELNWSSSGKGSATHLPGEFLHYLTKTKVTFVHYKTGPQRLLDLISGRVQVTMASFANVMGHIKAGRMRALGVTTDKRVSDWPEMPTIEEQGVPGYNFSSWIGLLAPARTPPAIINKLNAMFVNAYNDPNVRKIREAGDIFVGSTPEEFRRRIVTETDQWRKLIKETGMKVEGQ